MICAGYLIGNFWPWSFDLSDRNKDQQTKEEKAEEGE
jgi:hypothetical protein